MRGRRLGLALRGMVIALGGGAVVAATMVVVFDASAKSSGDSGGRQGAYSAAAAARGVPERVLLGVSYMESRWDNNQGSSTSGGYGPMHLTDIAGVTTRPVAGPQDGDDPRGDLARPLVVRRSVAAQAAPGGEAATRPSAGGEAATRPSAGGEAATRTAGGGSEAGVGGIGGVTVEGAKTLDTASSLTGVDRDRLKTDPAANIDAAAALLASYQRDLGASTGATTDPGGWYAAVARYSGASDLAAAQVFADEVFDVISQGMSRQTNDGQTVRLAGGEVRPDRSGLSKLGLRSQPKTMSVAGAGDTSGTTGSQAECPARLACEWVPADYTLLGDGSDPTNYRSYDKGVRPDQQKVDYIVIHDIEGDYNAALGVLRDPDAWTSWHYTVRGSDGGVAQHVKVRDVPWQAGNWYINTKSIGIEHEGYATDGTWFTETLYRSSARLVRYLAQRYGVKLDRAHIIGHDNVPGLEPRKVPGMHWDTGPYWDWDHYMALLGAPLVPTGTPRDKTVMIKPNFASNTATFTGCPEGSTGPCVEKGLSTVLLRSEPREDAALLPDRGLHRGDADPGAPTSMDIADVGSRVSAGQRFAVAETSGDWIAIWYNGLKGWFRNPASSPRAVWVTGRVVTPKAGRSSVPVYGGAFAEDAAYPAGVVPGDTMLPLSDYVFAAGQRYSEAGTLGSESYRAKTFDGSQPGDWTVIRGTTRYVQIQFGHRIGFVNADDVDII